MNPTHELKSVFDLNDFGYKLKALDAMNRSRLWMT